MPGTAIFVDESCKEKHQYLVLGGIVVEIDDIPKVLSAIHDVRSAFGLRREMKWTKISNGYVSAYRAFVDVFFDLHERDILHFHSVIIDTHRLDHAKYNQGDAEIGFSKFIYQLLVNKFGRLYSDSSPFHVYLDKRETKHSLEDLRNVLNNGIAHRYDVQSRPYRRVQFRDSKKSEILQLNDILIGAIGARKNGHHARPQASRARVGIADHIAARARIRDLGRTTPYGQRRFSIWNMTLR